MKYLGKGPKYFDPFSFMLNFSTIFEMMINFKKKSLNLQFFNKFTYNLFVIIRKI